MRRRLYIVGFFLFLLLSKALATHNRAGEITFRQTGSLTFEVTITTFTYQLSLADRSELEVQWGDNSTSIAPRYEKQVLPNYYFRNIYRATHTYPGAGEYRILVQDPNRNFGVQNIPNSVNTIFSIETSFLISPQIGTNNTPELLNYPFDKAALGHPFIHNPSAYDPDGDSLSYELTICTKENGLAIENYTFPAATDTFYVDAQTGDLTWLNPADTGIYNVAMLINEWRYGVKIGSIVRDMQIEVFRVNNQPPVNGPLTDLCVEAGDSVLVELTASDPDNDSITISASGGPFVLDESPASIENVSQTLGYSHSRLIWKTSLAHARRQPYSIVVKSTDNSSELKLVDLDNLRIRVIAPKPEGLTAQATSNSIQLRWCQSKCPHAQGYYVYRKESTGGQLPDSCSTGIDAKYGYVLIAKTTGITDTSYIDNNSNSGLTQGVEYCYRVVAWFADEGVSRPSDEACSILVPGVPSLTQVSVTRVDASVGEIFISWVKPHNLDTIPATGPYEYRIYRSSDLWGSDFNFIASFTTTDLADTTYTDSLLNTLNFPYSYKVELWNIAAGNVFLIGTPEIASSLYAAIAADDNRLTLTMQKNVPWVNTEYTVFRQNATTNTFDSIGTTSSGEYTDTGLSNQHEYCYQVRSSGWRQANNQEYYNRNLSHRNCGIPVDTAPPCAPVLDITPDCDLMQNQLIWTNPNNTCGASSEAIKYRIYYASNLNGPFNKIDSVISANDTVYQHSPQESIAACYYVSAIDSSGNESIWSNKACADLCTYYELPNVFSPNDDNRHDLFTSVNRNNYVKKVDMKIFNRWGTLIFQTSDPAINWDGRVKGTNEMVDNGVYYYVCDVYENRITGEETRLLTGFIYVFTHGGNKLEE